MPLSPSQWRIIFVVAITCIAINLVLYTSASFSYHPKYDEAGDGGSIQLSSARGRFKVSVKDRNINDRATVDRSLINDQANVDRSIYDRATVDRSINDRATVDRNVNDRTVVKGRSLHGKIPHQHEDSPRMSKWPGKKRKTKFRPRSKTAKNGGASHFGEQNEEVVENRRVKRLVDAEDPEPRKTTKFQSSSAEDELQHGVKELNSKPKLSQKSAASMNSAAAESKERFNIDTTLRFFQGCVGENGDIALDCFNNGYEELSKLFKPLGTIFSFVSSEIQGKIGILREYRQDPVHGRHFASLRSMLRYEMDNHLTVRPQGQNPSGSRTFLRLHWALQYIAALITKMTDDGSSAAFSEEATEAYDTTLAKHHPWYIRKGVHMATYTLPERRELLEKLNIHESSGNLAKAEALVDHLNVLYDISQKLYAENDLLDLP